MNQYILRQGTAKARQEISSLRLHMQKKYISLLCVEMLICSKSCSRMSSEDDSINKDRNVASKPQDIILLWQRHPPFPLYSIHWLPILPICSSSSSPCTWSTEPEAAQSSSCRLRVVNIISGLLRLVGSGSDCSCRKVKGSLRLREAFFVSFLVHVWPVSGRDFLCHQLTLNLLVIREWTKPTVP